MDDKWTQETCSNTFGTITPNKGIVVPCFTSFCPFFRKDSKHVPSAATILPQCSVQFSSNCPASLQSFIMDMGDNQISDMWGALNQWVKMEVDEDKQSAKRPRSSMSNGGKGPGKGKGKRGQGKILNTKDEPTQDTKMLLQAMTRLVLRHEDTLQCLAMETDFFVFLSVGPGSVVPLMMAQTQTWQQTPQAERTHPLRILVLKTLLEELLKRIQKLQSTGSSEPLIQTLQRLNFLQLEPEKPDSYMFPRMKWNSSKQAMEAQEDAPLTLTQASQTVTRMLTLLQQEALVKRFGALRPPQHIQKVMTTETETPSAIIPWRITLALVHPHANEMRGLWHQLSHSGLWQLVLGRMRSASIHRTPLAQHLGKMLDQL